MSDEAELNEAQRRIEALGLRLRERSVSDETFGNLVADFADDVVRARLLRDRGQWFIEIGSASGKAHDIGLHLRCLTHQQPAPDYTLEAQLAKLEPSFAAIRDAYRSSNYEDELRHAATARRKELGLG